MHNEKKPESKLKQNLKKEIDIENWSIKDKKNIWTSKINGKISILKRVKNKEKVNYYFLQ